MAEKDQLQASVPDFDPHNNSPHILSTKVANADTDIRGGSINGVVPDELCPPKKPKTNKYAIASGLLASMTSILLGYDTGVLSGASIYIKKDMHISDLQVGILVGTINIYSLIGASVAGRSSDLIGRRYTIVCAAVLFFIGALLMGFATNYAFLMVGRFFAGIGVGYALQIAPVYTVEVAPASVRGFLTSFPEVFLNSGILLGYISNYAFSKLPLKLGWRFMLGVGALPSIFLGIGVLAMPESPRWLVMMGRVGDAKRVLDKTSNSLEASDVRLAEIKEAVGIPEEVGDDEIVQVPESQHGGSGVWKELLIHPTPTVRHILIAAVGVHFFQQASGIESLIMYTPRIFEKAGIKSTTDKLLATIAVGFTKTIFVLVATFSLDKKGRRVLLLTSAAGMAVSLLGLATGLTIIDHYSPQKLTWALALCITFTLSSVGFFSIGQGPIPWVYSSEVFPLRLRAQGCGVAVALNRLTSGILLIIFIPLYKAITIGGVFYIFAAIAFTAFVFFYTLLPETRGKSLEEMEAMFGTFFKWRSTMRELDRKSSTRGSPVS